MTAPSPEYCKAIGHTVSYLRLNCTSGPVVVGRMFGFGRGARCIFWDAGKVPSTLVGFSWHESLECPCTALIDTRDTAACCCCTSLEDSLTPSFEGHLQCTVAFYGYCVLQLKV